MDTKTQAQELRRQGHTYGEIQTALGQKIAKSTLSYWCHGIPLPPEYQVKIQTLTLSNLSKGRQIGTEINRIKRQKFFDDMGSKNTPIASRIFDPEIGKIALSMLCLGEASKYNPRTHAAFSLGSSDPRIALLFLELLKHSFPDFDPTKVRCTVQCRADQDTQALQTYWQTIVGVPTEQFYKPRIDPRTQGKPTRKADYKGVLRIDYFSTKTQLDLESLADLIYNKLCRARGEVGYRAAMA